MLPLTEFSEDSQRNLGYYLLHSASDANQAHRVANNIIKPFEMMWRFVDDDEIDPTNNFAER